MSAKTEDIKETLSFFGSAVKNQRKLLGISQEELADRSGLHRTYITDVERGARNVSLDSITKLARALEVQLVELFARVERSRTDQPVLAVGLTSGKPIEILLVEDNAKHAELTLHALDKYGVTNPVAVVHTGEEALDFLYCQGRFAYRVSLPLPNIVLLDLTLPNVSGLGVLRRLRTDTRTQNITVVILTASRSDQEYKECVKLGVTAYINKPVDFLEFSTVMPKIGFRWQLVEHA